MSVKFSEVPDNYSPVFGDLVYTLTGVGEGESADAEVFTNTSADPAGVKRFKGAHPSVNISGYMRRLISPSPFPAESVGLFTDAGRFVTAAVGCRGSMSSVRTFTGAVRKLSEYEVLSTLPLYRTIAWDECDEISLLVSNCSMTYSWRVGGKGSYEFSSPEYITSRGIVTLAMGMQGISNALREAGLVPGDFDKLNVTVMAEGQTVAEVDYIIRRPNPRAVRLCWFNSLGAMDFHTFGNPLSDTEGIKKEMFLNHDGYASASLSIDRATELATGYLPAVWIEGLSGLLSSPLVWRAEDDEFVPVDVLSRNAAVNYGRLNSLDIIIRDRKPRLVQNF